MEQSGDTGRKWYALGHAAAWAAVAPVLLLAGPAGERWLALAVNDPGYDPLPDLMRPGVAAFLAATWVALSRVGRLVERVPREERRARLARLGRDDNGALIFEFALVFPFILALVFILFQWAELLMADALVHYAAFAAARTAATYASAPAPPDFTTGSRFTLDGARMDAMTRSAKIALAGAMAMEGAPPHQEPRVELIGDPNGEGNNTDVQIQSPRNGGGSYHWVHARVHWGFRPRWPLAIIFFRPLLDSTTRRIAIADESFMQVDGYYRSRSLRDTGRYKNTMTSPRVDTSKREGLTQQALYKTVLPEAHGASGAVSGTRDSLGNDCP